METVFFLSTSTISRHVRTKLPSAQQYSCKILGKCASERLTNDNLVYTQLYLDYLSDKDLAPINFFDESVFQLQDVGYGEECMDVRHYLSTASN